MSNALRKNINNIFYLSGYYLLYIRRKRRSFRQWRGTRYDEDKTLLGREGRHCLKINGE